MGVSMLSKRFLGGAALAATVLAAPSAVYAQVTTGTVRAYVSDESGAAVANATVSITHVPTGTEYVTVTGASGVVFESGLRVGGPYQITVSADGYAGQRVDGLTVDLGQTLDVNLVLEAGAADEIVVTASRAVVTAIGPSSVFSEQVLETAPAINRNIVEILRLDPRIYVDESRGDINSVQCGGANPRFNSFTLDGVRLNDSFGLNSNGYPTERQPFPYDAIEQVAVEMAPFDVEYGFFTACNISAVAKSGGNELHGTLFYDYTDDGLRAGSLESDNLRTGSFDEIRYGVQLSGPIVPNRLFFSVAYEKLEGANLFDRGPIGSGAVNEVPITQAELDEIAEIARTVWGYDPGDVPTSFANEDEKLLVKLDWNITDNHRATATYLYNDGFNIVPSDGDLDEFEFSNHLYERGAELTSYVGQVFSNWTDRFSTEARLSYTELDNRQVSLGGTDFGEIQIITDDVTVYLGADDSRHSNKLQYENLSYALSGRYDFDRHSLTVGYEREQIDVFNLFVQHTETEIRFRNEGRRTGPAGEFDPAGPFTAIENFRDGFANDLFYNNAPSNVPNDAAADWGYALNTLYAQDDITVNDALTVVLGLRYDWYTSDDLPAENPDFVADYGFSNAQNIDGEGLVQPRIAFNWDATPDLTLRGGVGRYSGGNPNVWLSNNYSANNVLQFGQRGRGFGLTSGLYSGPNPRNPAFPSQLSLFDPSVDYGACESGVPAGPGYCVPQSLLDAVAGGQGDNFEINFLDPDFVIPSEWKLALGADYFPTLALPGFLGGDYAINVDFIYRIAQDSAIVLRADLEQVGTTADGYPIYDSVREPAFVLTNSDEEAHSWTASIAVSKEWDNGFDIAMGYAYNDAEDIQPMTSSVAFSNYVNRAFFDPQEQVASTSDYNIRHRFTTIANYERAFFGEYLTRLSVYGSANSGAPYSIAQDGNSVYNFTPFLEGNPVLLAPGTRNEEEGSWWAKVDLRLEQELPGLFNGHRTSAFVVIDNFTNLLNDEWGILREVDFPATVEPGDPAEARIGDASRYEIRFGVRYDF